MLLKFSFFRTTLTKEKKTFPLFQMAYRIRHLPPSLGVPSFRRLVDTQLTHFLDIVVNTPSYHSVKTRLLSIPCSICAITEFGALIGSLAATCTILSNPGPANDLTMMMRTMEKAFRPNSLCKSGLLKEILASNCFALPMRYPVLYTLLCVAPAELLLAFLTRNHFSVATFFFNNRVSVASMTSFCDLRCR